MPIYDRGNILEPKSQNHSEPAGPFDRALDLTVPRIPPPAFSCANIVSLHEQKVDAILFLSLSLYVPGDPSGPTAPLCARIATMFAI